jgi:hypothetical protein
MMIVSEMSPARRTGVPGREALQADAAKRRTATLRMSISLETYRAASFTRLLGSHMAGISV